MTFPAQLRALRGWLVWRPELHPGDVKPRKVPYYVHGGRRSGRQGSDADRSQWASFEDAQRFVAENPTGEWHLGFAMSPDWGIVGLDFDECVSLADGTIDENVLSVISDTYSEFSPSGHGVHAFLSGSLPDRKSRAQGDAWGFEVFCRTGFLTMTGHATPVCELQGWQDELHHVNGAVSDLVAARFGSSDAISTLPKAPAGLDLGALRALLWRVTPDGSYSDWIRRGMALHHETGGSAEGLQLWDEHSALGDTYPGSELIESKWLSFGRDGLDGVSAVSVAYLQSVAAPDDSVFADLSGEDDRPPLPPQTQSDQSPGSRGAASVARLKDAIAADAGAPAPPRVPEGVKRRGIPEAHHLTTDQANANRLVNAFGRQVFVAAGRWHVWDGRRWLADEADVYRYGCRLSGIVRGEATAVEAKAALTGDPAEITKAAGIAKALRSWALKSEMKGTIEAAIGLARKMLTVDEKSLDKDPYALNVANGIVDLRTGVLRRHDPDELITKLVPVRYVPDAPCDVWLRVLREITREDHNDRVWPLAAYLQRWFGYCLTGEVSEQVFAVHWGGGANGKSTVLTLMAETLGDYATTAAPGLLMASKGERHPTEIASLMGRRMVTAHESGEGVVLREDFIKQATGDDVITARFMRGDFFDFDPTHKLQLLTNHKPQVKGQDHGIWRRVQLVPYEASFGTEDQVRRGTHTHVRDQEIVEKLQSELEGVLAWRVRGAIDWFAGGLQPPAVVLAASDAYKVEQDRVGQFVDECCEKGEGLSEPLTDGMGGLYPAFVAWCREGGVFPISKTRFVDDVLRVVGAVKLTEARSPVENGKRRKLMRVPGLRLLPEG